MSTTIRHALLYILLGYAATSVADYSKVSNAGDSIPVSTALDNFSEWQSLKIRLNY